MSGWKKWDGRIRTPSPSWKPHSSSRRARPKRFDRLIVVTCSDEQRVARFAARQKLDLDAARKEVARRMAAQLPEAEKIKAADYVIDNSGSLDQTREQVQQVWAKLPSDSQT